VRGFLSSPGPVAASRSAVGCRSTSSSVFLFHFWIGVTALGRALVIVCLTILTELMTRGPQRIVHRVIGTAPGAGGSPPRRNAEALRAMGMGPRVGARWCTLNEKFLTTYQRTSDVSGGFGRRCRRSCACCCNRRCWRRRLSRDLAGGDRRHHHRRLDPFRACARTGRSRDRQLARLRGIPPELAAPHVLLARVPDDVEQMALPKPVASLSVELLSLVPPGDSRLVVQDVSFRLEKGNALGIRGPSASGKSCLSRALVGVGGRRARHGAA